MWRTYFPNSHIFGIDIYDKNPHDEARIRTFKGSQADEDFLTYIVKEIGNIHIIIDDGSHINKHVLDSFAFLFPHLDQNGYYIIEDTQTSYWPNMGGDSSDLNRQGTTMEFFKRITDGLNYAEFYNPDYKPSYYDKNITAVHFFHNLIFIKKGLNNEPGEFYKN